MKNIVFIATILVPLVPFSLKAGRLQIVNENKKELTVEVRASGDPMTERLAKRTLDIPPEHYYEFYVSPSHLKGKSLFSIEGSTNPLTPGGSCKNMSVHKNYEVTFKNDTLGTTCVATELKS